MRNLLFLLAAMTLLLACQTEAEVKSLPILGERDIVDGDTVYHTIPAIRFIDQEGDSVTNATFQDKLMLADFFFTSCPTICPKVKRQMLRILAEYDDEDRLVVLSHSIDYRKDSVPVLKQYADKLGIDANRWHLVQLQKNEVEKYANEYFNVAFEDESAEGGFDHSGRIMLIDTQGRIRAYAEGTEPESVDQLIADIRLLLNET